MKIFEYVLYLKAFIDNLSWKRIFCIFVFILFSVFLILLVEVLGDIFFKEDLPMPGDRVKLLTISKDVKRDLAQFNKNSDLVIGIQIVTLNFQRNIRVETYVDIDNIFVNEVYRSFMLRRITDTPIFDSDKKNNDRMISILSGEFNCVSYDKSKAYTYAPQLKNYISDVCAFSIPPYNNEVTGIITIYFQRTPTQEEKNTVFLFLRDKSIKIFEDSANDLHTK